MKSVSRICQELAKARVDSRGRNCGIDLIGIRELKMSEEKTIVRPDNPFDDADTKKGNDAQISFPDVMGKDKADAKPENKQPAKPVEAGVLEVPKIEEKKTAQPAKAEKAEPARAEATERGAEKKENAPKEKANVQTIYDVREMFQQSQQLQAALAGLYVKQPDGSMKLRTDKIKNEQGQELSAEEVQTEIISRMSLIHETAIQKADQAMKNPEAVIGETLVAKSNWEQSIENKKALVGDLRKQGFDPSVNGYVDSSLLERFMEEKKDLPDAVKKTLGELKTTLEQETAAKRSYMDLQVLQQMPVITRNANAEFLSGIGQTSAAFDAGEDAKRVALALNSPAGRSEFMRETMQRLEKAKDSGLDQKLQDKYLNNPDNPFKLIQSAHEKAAKGDLDGARKDLEQARTNSKKFDPKEVEKDVEDFKKRVEVLAKEKTALEERQKEGKATPAEILRFQEKSAKIAQEAQILEAFHLAKPKADLAYADFLLNADKNKDSEANRKFARDILMNLRFDEHGKAAAAQAGEIFDRNLEKALNGNVDNRATLNAFNKKMTEYAEELNKASKQEDPEEIAKGLLAARAKAEEAKDIASKINRDGAHENEMKVRESMQKLIAQEQAKPADQRDDGKIRLLNEILKPAHLQDKKVVEMLVNASMPKPNEAGLKDLIGSVKNPNSITDVLGGYQMLKQSEMQKQAVNNARLAMLELDIHLDRGENNTLVNEVENDRYGAETIALLNAQPGTDGRTKWGDIKEATRDLAWYENAWKWLKGNIKDIAISIASGVAGTLAAIGTGALLSWSGPGAIVGGAAVGFSAGAGTSALLHKMCGDKFSWSSTILDGIGGASGGAFAAARTTTFAAGRAAVGRVAVANAGMLEARSATALAALGGESALLSTANQEVVKRAGMLGTVEAFKLAGMTDKVAIALGGNRFLATMSASAVGSTVYRYPTELLTGKYNSTSDWLKGSTMGVGGDMLFSPLGAYMNMRTGIGGDRVAKQVAWDFFSSSPITRGDTGGRYIRRNAVNSWLIDTFDKPVEAEAEKK